MSVYLVVYLVGILPVTLALLGETSRRDKLWMEVSVCATWGVLWPLFIAIKLVQALLR